MNGDTAIGPATILDHEAAPFEGPDGGVTGRGMASRGAGDRRSAVIAPPTIAYSFPTVNPQLTHRGTCKPADRICPNLYPRLP